MQEGPSTQVLGPFLLLFHQEIDHLPICAYDAHIA
jgi:hypothetical protein